MRKLPVERILNEHPALPKVNSRYLSQVPALAVFIGKIRSGKSMTAVSLIDFMRREGSVTRVFVISPSVRSNAIYDAICKDPERDWKITLSAHVFEDLGKIEDACEADAERWREAMEYAVAYRKYVGGERITRLEEHFLEQKDYKPPEPKDLVRPSPLIFCDDCQSSSLFKRGNNAFVQFCLRCRHISGGVGCSVFVAIQSSKAVPPALRLNWTHMFLYATHSKTEQRILADEVGAMCSEEEFVRLLNLYTALPHSYCFVDLVERRIANSF